MHHISVHDKLKGDKGRNMYMGSEMENLIAVMRAVGGRNRYSTNLLSGEGGCNDCENIFYKKDFNCTTIPLSSTNCIPFVTNDFDLSHM